MAGRFGHDYGSSSTTPYVSVPKRPPVFGAETTTSGPTPRGPVEHFPTSPDMLSQAAGFASQQPGVVAERPLALIDQVARFFMGTGSNEAKQGGLAQGSGPVNAALAAIGHVSIGLPGRKEGEGFSIGSVVRAAEAGLQEEGTWNGALMNFRDAGHIKYIEDHHLGPNDIVPGMATGKAFSFDDKPMTVSEYYNTLQKRQFFTDPKTGQQLTPADLVDKINAAGPLGALQFGDRQVTEDPTLNAVLKMGTDPLNVAFMAGGPAFVAARYGAFSGKIMASTKAIGEWALPSVWKAAGAGKVAHGVGEFEDVGRLIGRLPEAKMPSAASSAEAIVGGDVSKATAKGLAVLLRNGMKEVFLPGSGGLVTRYYRGAMRDQLAGLAIEHLPGIGDQYDPEGNKISSGWFSAAHDAAEAVLDDHTVSGSGLFNLITVFSMPVRKLAAEYPAAAKVASGKAFGYRGEAQWAKDGGFSDSLGQGKNAVSEMNKAWGEGDAAVGIDRRNRLVDQLNLKITFDRVMRNPAWKLLAKSLDQSAFTSGMFLKILRTHSNYLLATGKINEKLRISTFDKWATDHLTSYIDPVTGEIAHLTFPAGFSLTKQGKIDQWIRYDKANTGLTEAVGPLHDAVLGRAPVLSKEGALAIESVVRDMMDENGWVSPLATGTIRDTLAQFPASFLEPVPANTREFLAALMNEGVASKGYDGELIIQHLEAMSKRLPSVDDLFHEANIKEAAAPVDVYSGPGGPLQAGGVSQFHTPAQFKEHQINSISEARQLKQDIADSQQYFDDRWERDHHKGGAWKYKGEPLAPEAVAPDMTQANLDTMRANDQAHIDGLRARLLELRKAEAESVAAGKEEGVIDLDPTFYDRNGNLNVAPETLDLLLAQTKYIHDNLPDTFQVKRAPAVHVPWSMADGAIGAIHQQRTNLGRIVFDYGPLAQMTKFIDYMLEPVSASGRAADARAMVYSMFMKHGATEQEVTKYLAAIDTARSKGAKVGPMQVTVGGRGLNGFMPNQLNEMAHEVWGPQYGAGDKLMSKGNPQFVENIRRAEGMSHGLPEYYKIIDRASNSLVRKGEQAMLEGNYGLGGKQLLSRMFAKGYGMWQDAPFSGPTRMVAQLYPLFRFTLSARWQAMNRGENFLLGMFKDGIRSMLKPVREDLQSRQMYALAKGRVPGGATDPAMMRPPRSTIVPVEGSTVSAKELGEARETGPAPATANLPDTGVITGRFMEPAMRRQFQTATDEKAFIAAIDELPINAPEIKWFVDMFGTDKATWSAKANSIIYGSEASVAEATAWSKKTGDMLTSWDTKGIHETMQDAERQVAASDQWTPAQRAEIAPFLLRLEEKHAGLYKDIADIQMGNTDRSRLERLMNSYWLYWPISYQIKTTRWMVDLLSNKAFGHQTNLGGAYILTHGRQMIQEQMDNNPEFADQMANNETLWMMANMMFPAVPWDQAVSLSRIPRYVGANVMHWFPTYAGLDNPFDYARKAMELGPFYDSSLGSELLTDKGSFIQSLGADNSTQEVVQPYRH